MGSGLRRVCGIGNVDSIRCRGVDGVEVSVGRARIRWDVSRWVSECSMLGERSVLGVEIMVVSTDCFLHS